MQESQMKAESTASPNDSESAQSSTTEKVRGKKLRELPPGEQTSPHYTVLPISLSLQSSCQDAGSSDTMFTCLPSIPGATDQNPTEAEAGTSEYFSLRSACSSGCVSSHLNLLCFKARAAHPLPPAWSVTQPPVPSSLGARPPSTSPRAALGWASALWAAVTPCW